MFSAACVSLPFSSEPLRRLTVTVVFASRIRLAMELRADYLVERGGELLVAEVKTGEEAPSLETAATRRQLLEYHVAFAVDGVLLVSPEQGTIQRVAFPRVSLAECA